MRRDAGHLCVEVRGAHGGVPVGQHISQVAAHGSIESAKLHLADRRAGAGVARLHDLGVPAAGW